MAKIEDKRKVRLGAWMGMIGSIFFITIFTIEGLLRPNYYPMSMYISELALGPRGWIQNLNFILLGSLFLIFVRGVASEFHDGKASKAGPILLMIIGCSFIASGFLVMDPLTTPSDQMSWHGFLHEICGAFVFALAPFTCIVFYRRFHEDSKWHSLQWWTLISCIIIFIAIIGMKVGSTQFTAEPNIFNAWIGLIQRIALITFLIWIMVFAFKLMQVKHKE